MTERYRGSLIREDGEKQRAAAISKFRSYAGTGVEMPLRIDTLNAIRDLLVVNPLMDADEIFTVLKKKEELSAIENLTPEKIRGMIRTFNIDRGLQEAAE